MLAIILIPAVCALECSEDSFSCTSWGECQEDNHQERTCALVSDCPNVLSPWPEERKACEYTSPLVREAKCTMDYLGDRIACRIELNASDVVPDLAMAYIPEECITLQGSKAIENCTRDMGRFTQCRQFPYGQQRVRCAKQVIGLHNTTPFNCTNNTLACDTWKSQIVRLTLFRMDELAVRAQDLYQHGRIPKEHTVTFIAEVERRKENFRLATSYSERRRAILEVRKLWQDLLGVMT